MAAGGYWVSLSSPYKSGFFFPFFLMRYAFNLPAIPADLHKVAQTPEIGVDSYIARFSPFVPVHVGSVRFSAAAVATYESANNPIPAGWHLGARVNGGPLYGTNITGALTPIVVTLAATLQGNVTDNVVATFTSPAWSIKPLNLYPKFITRDLLPATPANASTSALSVNSLVSVAGGAPGDFVEVWAFPPLTSYSIIDCIEDKNGGPPRDQIIAIPCGRNPQAHTKNGRAEPQELELTMPYKGFLEQLARFQGVKGTVSVEIRKDDQAYTQLELYSGYIPSMEHSRTGGNDTVNATFTAPFEQFFAGYAV